MTDFGAIILAIGIIFCGCAIDNGLTNIANVIRKAIEELTKVINDKNISGKEE